MLPGRARKIPTWAEKALAKRLEEPQGFESYGAIQEWLKTNLGIIAPYKTVHKKRVLSPGIIAKSTAPDECGTVTTAAIAILSEL